MLPNLPDIQGEKAKQLISNQPGVNGLELHQNERQVNVFRAPVDYTINFLHGKFDKGLQYRNLNYLRSATSAYHVHVDGKSVGKHPKVCELLTSISNQRPPQPRCFCMGCGDSSGVY